MSMPMPMPMPLALLLRVSRFSTPFYSELIGYTRLINLLVCLADIRVSTHDGWDHEENESIATAESLVSVRSEQDPSDQLAALERSLSELSEITRFRQRRDYHITLQEELLDLYKSQEPSVPVKRPEYATQLRIHV